MIYLFDTSAVNRLHDDTERDSIVQGLTATNEVWVSALNVAEAGGTRDAERRVSLLRLLKSLTGWKRPLEMPPFLLRRCIEAYAAGRPSVDITVGTENDGVWQALLAPENLEEEDRVEVRALLLRLETEFRETHRENRPFLQDALEKDSARPKSVSELIRAYASNEEVLYGAVSPFYEDVVGSALPRERTQDIFQALPPLTGFLLAWGHAIYHRGIAQEGYGKGNAGNTDLWFAIYLGKVDRFVTNDRRQYQALRLVRQFYAPNCEVLSYDVFRGRTILG